MSMMYPHFTKIMEFLSSSYCLCKVEKPSTCCLWKNCWDTLSCCGWRIYLLLSVEELLRYTVTFWMTYLLIVVCGRVAEIHCHVLHDVSTYCCLWKSCWDTLSCSGWRVFSLVTRPNTTLPRHPNMGLHTLPWRSPGSSPHPWSSSPSLPLDGAAHVVVEKSWITSPPTVQLSLRQLHHFMFFLWLDRFCFTVITC